MPTPELQRVQSVDQAGPLDVPDVVRKLRGLVKTQASGGAALIKPSAAAQLVVGEGAAGADSYERQRSSDVLLSTQVACVDVALTGGKGSSLAILNTVAGVDVPPFFAVSTNAFRKTTSGDGSAAESPVAVALAKLQELSMAWTRDQSQANLMTVFEQAKRLRSLVVKLPPPEDTVAAVKDAYAKLCADMGDATGTTPVAVRSSATTEDLEEACFAGQHDTFLNQRGIGDVVTALRRCWASVFTDRAVEYRNRQKPPIPHVEAVMGVVVQAMVDPYVAGTAFSVELSTSFPALHVAATYGLGEAVVSGEVTSDEWLMDPESLTVIKRSKGSKSSEFVFVRKGGKSGVRQVAVDEARRTRYCMTDATAQRVAAGTRAIAAAYKVLFGYDHVDTEFAVEKSASGGEGAVRLLQSRPVVAIEGGDIETVDPTDVRSEGDIIVRSSYSLLGAVSGRVKVITEFDALVRGEVTIEAEDILVTAKTSNYWNQYLTSLRGIVTMDGSPTAHPMLIGRERGLPVLCGIPDLMERAMPYNGKWVTLDGLSKALYRGERRLRTATMDEFRRQFVVQRVVPYKDDESVLAFLEQYHRVAKAPFGRSGVWVKNPNNYLSPAWRKLRLTIYPCRLQLVNEARRRAGRRGPIPEAEDPFGKEVGVIGTGKDARVADLLVPVAQTMRAFEGMGLDECEAMQDTFDDAARDYLRACEAFGEPGGATVANWRAYCKAYGPMYAAMWLSFFWRMHVKHKASEYVHGKGVSVYMYEAYLSHVQEAMHGDEEDAKCRHAILKVAALIAPHVAHAVRAIAPAGDAKAEEEALQHFADSVLEAPALLRLVRHEPRLIPALTTVASNYRMEKCTDITQPRARSLVLKRALAEVDIVSSMQAPEGYIKDPYADSDDDDGAAAAATATAAAARASEGGAPEGKGSDGTDDRSGGGGAAAAGAKGSGGRGGGGGGAKSPDAGLEGLGNARAPEVDFYPADKDMRRWLTLHLRTRVSNSNNHHFKWRGQCLMKDQFTHVADAAGMRRERLLQLDGPSDIEAVIRRTEEYHKSHGGFVQSEEARRLQRQRTEGAQDLVESATHRGVALGVAAGAVLAVAGLLALGFRRRS